MRLTIENNTSKRGTINPGIAIIGIIVVAAIAVITYLGSMSKTPSSASYKDGTYMEIGEYMSPGGQEELDVTITLKDGVISDVQVISKAFRPNSVRFQGEFVANYKRQVLGKNIDEVNLTKVSGSSLAPKGFNDAVEKIKTEAKA